jgi:putative hydrolase of the HAD superfamily
MQAVIFDLGGVVFDSPLEFIREYERRLGLPEHFVARIVGGYGGTDGPWHRLERGELPLASFCAQFDADIQAAGENVSSADLMNELAARSKIRPAMLEAIRAVRSRGLKVAALTNNWIMGDDHEHDARLESLRIEFHVFVESCKVGMRKPDPRIYELTCQKLDIEPSRAVFLDDMGQNLKAAKGLGMTTIKVGDPASAIAELERILDASGGFELDGSTVLR